MPPQASQSSSLPPLPAGYTLDSSTPPLPAGYTLDSPAPNLKTGEGMEAYAQNQAHQVPVQAMRQAHGAISLMGHPASSQAQDESFDEALSAPTNPLKNPFSVSFSGSSPYAPPGMQDVARDASLIPSLAGAMSPFSPHIPISIASDVAQEAPSALRSVKNAIGGFLRDPVTGKLTPLTRETARAIGAGAGYEAGKDSGHGMEGMLLGGAYGPGMADAVIPASQSAMYEARAADLMKRQAQQDALDRQAALEGKPVPIRNSPNFNPDAYASGQASRNPAPLITSSSSPYDPGLRHVGNEGRPATWTNERVLQLAKGGDRQAIVQAVRRGLPLPDNARYVAGDANYPAGSFNPRDVTTFTPEGTPVRQGTQIQPINTDFSGARVDYDTANAGDLMKVLEDPTASSSDKAMAMASLKRNGHFAKTVLDPYSPTR